MKEIFDRIHETYSENSINISNKDILASLMEEIGEFARAIRVESVAPTCHNKKITESSREEAIDILLVAIEAYIHRGGRYEEMLKIIDKKLIKWETLWEEYHKIHD